MAGPLGDPGGRLAAMGLDRSGIWGPVTATMDWCEENYVVHEGLAEFWNTLTSFSMVLPCAYAMMLVQRHRLGTRFLWHYAALMVVGAGSVCFHGTLLYETQLMDELPMVYATLFLVYNAFETSEDGTPIYGAPLLGALGLYAGLFSYLYTAHVTNPVFHQTVYGATVVTLVLYTIAQWRRDPELHEPSPDWNGKHRIGTGQVQFVGYLLYLAGFMLWNVDNVYCEHLRLTRIALVKSTGYFTGNWILNPLLQLHGLWHIFTGFGSFVLFTAQVYMQMLKRNRRDCRLVWKMGWLPVVESVPLAVKKVA
ncbi:alkaline phytoceramidase [Gonapodya prolifera JEL478]|uniref:Alkaline phytoceramidase n=1 Tax=Gonapodya prolifera (strain JEL478) TaxID=1344416 RepID=A0A139A0I6_GONPJ|nr:alkaline phytoceramidase [Gonapodya prolifera JEL478]|eukprot:KXS10296.1 alkaline phytoceramidase [Gonapodya prolifera JEL478]